MASFLGGCGPGWYMEGMAELFATHRLDDKPGSSRCGSCRKSREEVPMLGRIKLIRDAVADQQTLSFAGRDAARQPRAAGQRGLRLVLGRGQVSRYASALPRPLSSAVQERARSEIQRHRPPRRTPTIGPTSRPNGRPTSPRSIMATISTAWRSTFSPGLIEPLGRGRATPSRNRRPTAAGSRPVSGSRPASRTKSPPRAATKLPPSKSTASQPGPANRAASRSNTTTAIRSACCSARSIPAAKTPSNAASFVCRSGRHWLASRPQTDR